MRFKLQEAEGWWEKKHILKKSPYFCAYLMVEPVFSSWVLQFQSRNIMRFNISTKLTVIYGVIKMLVIN